jgi:P27 family predicted phage terminase small subunit
MTTPKAPTYLRAPTRRWFEDVCRGFVLEEHHRRLLVLAAESWDRCQQAREAIARHGLTAKGRFGAVKARPEVAIERDAKIAFARMLRELALDVEAPQESRPPAIKGQAALRVLR